MGKATEFDKLRKRRRIKRAFRRTTMLMIFGAIALSLFLIWSVAYQLDFTSRAQNFFSSLKPGSGFPVAVDDMNVEKLLPLGKDVAVITTSGNYVYNSRGARLATFLNSYNIPVTHAAGGKLLADVRLFDVYRDEKRVGAGKKSMAFSLTYRAADRTLTSEEVEKAHEKLVTKVCKSTGGEVRS